MKLLDLFMHIKVYRPDVPDTLRWIDMDGRTVYENTGAKEGAKIIRLI